MKKIIAFAGSNSSTSINKQLIQYAASLVENAETEIISLEDYEPPVYSIDHEKEYGSHESVKRLYDKLNEADGLIISASEHNHGPQAFFKNILDWLTRVQFTFLKDEGRKALEDMPVLLMSTSPGRGGAADAREKVKYILEVCNAKVIAEFELASFNHTAENGKITDKKLNEELKAGVKKLEEELK
ncbi:MAG: NAD(P)H-dependent oxidoreductase [Crocinitomicaceae bacterium]